MRRVVPGAVSGEVRRFWRRVSPLSRRQFVTWAGMLALRRVQLATALAPLTKGATMRPHTVHTGTFTSDALRRTLPYTLLLPADFDPALPHGVLYLLHGMGGTHMHWAALSDLPNHAAPYPLVIVCPDAENSCYVNGANGERWEDAIAADLPAHIEARYGVRTDRDGRAIAGLSMGGFGAFNIGMRHPERYVAVSTLSGAFMMSHLNWGDDNPQLVAILGPVGSPTRREYDPENVLAQAVATHGADALPMLAMDVGTADYPDLVASNRRLHDALRQSGVPHTYREEAGGHTWEYWNREIPFTLGFVATAMGLIPDATEVA